MIFGTATYHSINMVTILHGKGELFQHEYADPFAPHIAIGHRREGFAASILREHARFAETDMCFGGHQGIDTPNDCHSTLTTLNCIYASVNSDQGTGAGRLDWLTRSMQVEKITHATRSYRGYLTGGRIALNGHTCPKQPFTIATARRAHKQSRIGS